MKSLNQIRQIVRARRAHMSLNEEHLEMLFGDLLSVKANSAPRSFVARCQNVIDNAQILVRARQPVFDRAEWLGLTHLARTIARRAKPFAASSRRIDHHAVARDLPIHVARIVATLLD